MPRPRQHRVQLYYRKCQKEDEGGSMCFCAYLFQVMWNFFAMSGDVELFAMSEARTLQNEERKKVQLLHLKLIKVLAPCQSLEQENELI